MKQLGIVRQPYTGSITEEVTESLSSPKSPLREIFLSDKFPLMVSLLISMETTHEVS